MLKTTLSLVFCLGVAGVGTSVASDKVGDNSNLEGRASTPIFGKDILILRETISSLEQVVAKLQPHIDPAAKGALNTQLTDILKGTQEIWDYLDALKTTQKAVELEMQYNRTSLGVNDDAQLLLRIVLQDGPAMKKKTQLLCNSLQRLCSQLGIEQAPQSDVRENPLYKKYQEDVRQEKERRQAEVVNMYSRVKPPAMIPRGGKK